MWQTGLKKIWIFIKRHIKNTNSAYGLSKYKLGRWEGWIILPISLML
jgi:hypothetical protein